MTVYVEGSTPYNQWKLDKRKILVLKKIRLKNYRCFVDSEISFRSTAIIVGQNNAGKSTLIEALRILSAVAQKFKHTNYFTAPLSLGLPAVTKGLKVNIDHLKIDLRSVVNQYGESNGVIAEIAAYFDQNIVINVYLSSEIFFGTVTSGGKQVCSKSDALKIPDIQLYIMPQIGLIREDEQMLAEDTVRNHMSTRLASRHFRNQLWLERTHFDEFKEIAQKTWPGLRIENPEYMPDENKIELLVYDANFAAEIGLMGSGLQMWLQMVWFLGRCPASCTVVLDEPDVYMHPDLQQKILRIVQRKFNQTIIATHSVEIISAVESNQIVTVDKASRKMCYADSLCAVQKLVNDLGSNYNLSLIRLGGAKKCIFVEGKDLKALSKFHEILYPSSNESLDQLPVVELGGWSRFNEALGAARLFHEETGGEIKIYCILDRDYHSQAEVNGLMQRAEESHLQLHIWERKELENYILSPQSIFRLTDKSQEEYSQFRDELLHELEALRMQTLGGLLDQFDHEFNRQSPSTNLELATSELDKHWATLEKRLSVCNGKDLISLINRWIKESYKKSSSRARLLKALTPEDIPDEMKSVISMLIEK